MDRFFVSLLLLLSLIGVGKAIEFEFLKRKAAVLIEERFVKKFFVEKSDDFKEV